MLFRQLFDEISYTYTYLIADKPGGKALIIDPVLEKLDIYQELIDALNLKLSYAIDTHVHADHITAIGKLRDLYGCATVHGERSKARGITHYVCDEDCISLDTITLRTLYTPGHTDDSYCFLIETEPTNMLFTGDTLLIRGTGRTDFQHGNAVQQYDSLFNKILSMDDSTLVYPGHDYRGMTVSTIGEEKQHNPRLQVKNNREYAQLMGALKLDKPKQMDTAVPANLNGGV